MKELKPLSMQVASTSVICLNEDSGGKKKLGDILGFCFDTLKLYGKEPEQIASVNKMFQFILADYPIDKIVSAFKFYFAHNSEMPTPADIAGIIKRGNKPPLDKTVYMALTKKKEHTRSNEEDKYINEYEKFHLSGDEK